MRLDDLKIILNKIKNAKIGIIGDFCLDVYWHINEAKSEISVETNLETRPIEEQRYSLGGAGNVANNLHTMGIKHLEVFGVLGNDPFGAHMKSIMTGKNIITDGLFIQKEKWSTHVYIKPISKGEEENRIDFGNFNELDDATAIDLVKYFDARISELDAVIINEQVISGIHHSETFRIELQKVVNKYSDKIFILDSRHYGGEYKNVVHKINAYEATTLCGLEYKPDDFISLTETKKSMIELYKKWQKPIFVTRGARGCLVIDKDECFEIHGLHLTGKLDTVGAGDSMLSGITACLAKNYDVQTAATFGNFVAGVTVQKLYITGTATPEEILKIGFI